MKKENKEIVECQNLVNKLLSLLGSKAEARVNKDEELDALVVNIETEEERGLLIGRKGETLSAIQTFIGIALKNKTGEWRRIILNIGDWREKQNDYLSSLAKSTTEKVTTTGEPQPLYNLTPEQRRIIHLELSENPDVFTESEGEGKDRYLVVKPKSSKK